MPRSLKYTVVDAFTSEIFSGNPAAVVVIPEDAILDQHTMQYISREFNLSETAFVSNLIDSPPQDGKFIESLPSHGNKFGLRWFTPTAEVPICGHATLAAAYVLSSVMGSQDEELGSKQITLSFETKSGTLPGEVFLGGENTKIMITLPAEITSAANEALTNRTKLALKRAITGNGLEHDVAYVGVTSNPIYDSYMLIELASSFDLANAEINAGAFVSSII